MRGSGIILRSSPVAACLILLWAGCAGSSGAAVQSQQERPSPLREFLERYERTFRPSEYDPDIGTLLRQMQAPPEAVGEAGIVTPAVPETIPGFRVQLLLTQDIDRANGVRDSLNAALPDDWVYVVYDAPYYKVRVGNYRERPAANAELKHIVALGYRDAWVVPDLIVKNPPPKLPDTFIVPEHPFDQHR